MIKYAFNSDKKDRFKDIYYRQPDGYSCGATTVKMASLIYKTKNVDIEEIKQVCSTNPQTGTIETGIMAGLNYINLSYQRSYEVVLDIKQDEIYLDSILNSGFTYIMRTLLYGVKHWILLYEKTDSEYYLCLDPTTGIVNYHKDFLLKAHELRDFDGFTILKRKIS
jgi:hypothetical protein